MRVEIKPGFWLAAAGLLLLDRWGLAPAFLLAAAAHEAGHLAALERLQIPVRSMELRAGGAVIRAPLRGAPQEALALAAGPGVNLLLALFFWRLWPRFALCNLWLGLWNLLPLPRRDGGALLRLLRLRRKKQRKALAKTPGS